jgi:hypothetical protein
MKMVILAFVLLLKAIVCQRFLMEVFKDLFTGDEYINDSFNITLQYNDVAIKVHSKYINSKSLVVEEGCKNLTN